MVLSDVLLNPSEFDGATILAPWTSRIGDQFEVLHTSIFGNFFLVDRLGRVSLLDSWSGEILGVSSSYDAYRASVSGDAEFFRSWFLTDLAGLLVTNGLSRSPGQVYAPFVSPALGGKLAANNFSLAPLRAYVAASAAEVLARASD
jgi:hypothetical protein